MYSALAEFYDDFIDGDYYQKWFQYVRSFLKDCAIGFDVGCGSGLFTRELHKAGKKVVGIDSSSHMLEKAVKRTRSEGLNITYVLGGAENFVCAKEPDFITAMCDVVNYMKDPRKFFCNAYKNLAKGGVLIFDISSRFKLEKVIGNNTFSESVSSGTYIWKNVLNSKSGYVDMALKFFKKNANGFYEKTEESQRQYIHLQETLEKELKDLGFEVQTYGDLTKSKPKEKSMRIHFLAKKPEKISK